MEAPILFDSESSIDILGNTFDDGEQKRKEQKERDAYWVERKWQQLECFKKTWDTLDEVGQEFVAHHMHSSFVELK